MNKRLKVGGAIKRREKMTFEWMECRRFSLQSTHPTQSHVKVHSTSILTGPRDQDLGKMGPPFCYTLSFGDAGR